MKKIKKGYKPQDGVGKHSLPNLEDLLIKKKKLESQIELAKKRKWIKGRPSTIRRGGKYVKKGGKV
jgi:hypothetical protein